MGTRLSDTCTDKLHCLRFGVTFTDTFACINGLNDQKKSAASGREIIRNRKWVNICIIKIGSLEGMHTL